MGGFYSFAMMVVLKDLSYERRWRACRPSGCEKLACQAVSDAGLTESI